MEIRKASALATLIAIVSCKMKIEGLYELNENGKEYYIKPELIIELWEKYSCFSMQFGSLTNEEIYEVTHLTYQHDTKFTDTNKNEVVLIEGIRCSEGFIDQIFNIVRIEPQHHLREDIPVCKPINQTPVNRENHI